MIRLVALSGSPVKDGNTEAVLEEAVRAGASGAGVGSQIIHLSGLEITGCRHCNWCLKNQTVDKFCVSSDGMDEIYPALVEADAIVLATPVHIGRISGITADLIDRMRVFVYGNVHRGELKDKVGAGIVVAFLRHGGLETTLGILNNTFALFHMVPVGRGGLVLSSVDGKGKTTKGVRHMALEDAFGLGSAEETVRRAVELAKIIQAGKAALDLK